MINKELLHERFCSFLKEEGVTQKFIAKKLKISESILSRWKKKNVELDLLDSEKLDEFLTNKGY